MDLSIMDKINPTRAEAVAKEIGVPTEVLMGWLIDGRMPKLYIEKMAKLFNRPFEYYVKGLYEPPQYKQNRQKWERL